MTAHEDRQPEDASVPALLLVSLGGVLAAVVGVVAVGQTSAVGMLLAAVVVLLAGTVIVLMTIGRQLDDADGEADPRPDADRDDHAQS